MAGHLPLVPTLVSVASPGPLHGLGSGSMGLGPVFSKMFVMYDFI